MYTIPNSADMIKQSQIPIALSISPLAKLRPDEVRETYFVCEEKANNACTLFLV